MTDPRLTKPTVCGTGLIALDVVVNVHSHDRPRYYSGGTCGNVLTILSYLGWKSVPICRLSPGPASDRVVADLRRWKVSTKFVEVEDTGSTPIIIHRISRTATGDPYHSFSWRCPGCGAYLPGYKPVLASTSREVAPHLPAARVFFFDRVSRGAIHLAKAASDRGALVLFEPSGVGDPGLFREAWSIAHVVKYSHERLRDIADLDLEQSERDAILLEIETLGPDGLRFRSRLPRFKNNAWRHLHAIKPQTFQDAAGAGDWCTAGILHKLANRGLAGFCTATSERLNNAVRYGQALATWNCGFEGARGGMYHVTKETFDQQVAGIIAGADTQRPVASTYDRTLAEVLGSLCPSCKATVFAVSQPVRRIPSLPRALLTGAG